MSRVATTYDFYPIHLIKLYLDQFRGISSQGWYRVALTFINDLASGIIFFLPIYFVQILHYSVATAGIVISCHGIGKAIGGYIGGKLSEKTNPEIILMCCLLIDAILFAGLIKSISLFAIIVIVSILGITAYAFSTANKICLFNANQSDEKSQIKLLSLFYSSSNLGIGLSAIIVSYLSAYGFNAIFFASSVMLSFTFVFVFFQRKKAPVISRVSTNSDSNGETTRVASQQRFMPYVMLSCLFCVGLIISQLSSTYPVYLATIFADQGIHAVSMVFALNSMMILFLQTPVGNYFGRFNKIFIVGLGAFMMAASMSLLIATHSLLMLFITMLGYTFGEMIFFSLVQFVIYQHSTPWTRARNIGLFQTVLAVSMIIGPTAGGYLYHQCSSNTVWLLCGVMGLLWLAIVMHYKKYDLMTEV